MNTPELSSALKVKRPCLHDAGNARSGRADDPPLALSEAGSGFGEHPYDAVVRKREMALKGPQSVPAGKLEPHVSFADHDLDHS